MEKLIIVGSGPAAYTSAIYAARADLSPLVFESSVEAGGALMLTTEVENFPGFPEGIMGPELMARMRAQAERFGARLIPEDAVAMKLTDAVKGVRASSGEVFKSEALILATGSAHKKLGLEHEDELSGRGVSYCATCDAPFFRNLPTGVVGGGDTALEEALFLSKFSPEVLVFVRGESLRASQIMQDRARNNPGIKFLFNTQVKNLILSEGKLSGVEVVNAGSSQSRKVPLSGLFVAIGHVPRSSLVADYLPIDEAGYVLAGGAHGSTSTTVPGVFVAGDVADHRYRQAITAAGTGAQAALDAEKYLTTR